MSEHSPSSYRYRRYGCRCRGCVAANHAVRTRYEANRRLRRQFPIPTTMHRLYREIGIVRRKW